MRLKKNIGNPKFLNFLWKMTTKTSGRILVLLFVRLLSKVLRPYCRFFLKVCRKIKRIFLFFCNKIYDFIKRVYKDFLQEHVNRLSPYKNRFFAHMIADFPDQFPSTKNALKRSLSHEKIVDKFVSIAFIKLEPLKEVGLKYGLFIHFLKRSLTVKKYYDFCYDILKLQDFLLKKNRAQMGKLHSLNELTTLPMAARKRNILFITSEFPSPFHGGGNRVLSFMKVLAKTNRLFLVSTFNETYDNDVLKNVSPYCASILKIPSHQWGDNEELILNWLGDQEMDIVHYEWPGSLRNFSRKLGKKHIFTFMECVSLRLLIDLRNNYHSRNEAVSALWELVRFLLVELKDTSDMDALIAVTNKDALFLQSLFPSNDYYILNHGFDIDEFNIPDARPEPNTLVFLGNYLHYPNVDAMKFFLKEIFPKVKENIPSSRIYIVGPNAPKDLLEMGSNSSVIFTGQVPDIRPFVQRAEICIAPLVSGAGLRGKVIDYAALRRPFIASDIAISGLVFRDGSDYLSANTADEFIENIVLLMRNPQLREELSANAHKTVRLHYDNNRLVESMMQLYVGLENHTHVE